MALSGLSAKHCRYNEARCQRGAVKHDGINECIFVLRRKRLFEVCISLYLGHIWAEEALQAALHAAVVD
jgi:hypothetical protein